jgi:hypothetical protein
MYFSRGAEVGRDWVFGSLFHRTCRLSALAQLASRTSDGGRDAPGSYIRHRLACERAWLHSSVVRRDAMWVGCARCVDTGLLAASYIGQGRL